MAKKFYTDIDLNGNKLQNATLNGATAGKVVVFDSNGKLVASEKGLTDFIEKQADATSFSGTVEAGKTYVLTNLSSLTISSIAVSNLESNIFFTTAASLASTFLTLPNPTQIIGEVPTFEANASYVMSVLEGVVVFGEINYVANAPVAVSPSSPK